MNERAPKRPNDLLDQIEACEGTKRLIRRRLWGYTFYTFSKNGLELRNKLREYEDPARAFARLAATKRLRDEQFRADIIRHFHNFLAGAKSLVDHTRNSMKDTYWGDQLLTDYHDRVRHDFGKNGFISFVHDLRNYMLHVARLKNAKMGRLDPTIARLS